MDVDLLLQKAAGINSLVLVVLDVVEIDRTVLMTPGWLHLPFRIHLPSVRIHTWTAFQILSSRLPPPGNEKFLDGDLLAGSSLVHFKIGMCPAAAGKG